MITERLSFRARYGHGDELVAIFRELSASGMMPGGSKGRIYTDLTGPMFSVITEIDYESLDAFSQAMQAESATYATPEFQQMFARMMEVAESGDRQILNMEEITFR